MFNVTHLEPMFCERDDLRHKVILFASLSQLIFSFTIMNILGVLPLMISNGIGLIFLILSFRLAKTKRNTTIFIIFLTYSILSVLMAAYLLEATYGFIHYMLLMIPVVYVFMYGVVSNRTMVIFAIATILLVIATYWLHFHINDTVNSSTGASTMFMTVIKIMNGTLIALLMLVFVSVFVVHLECVKRALQRSLDSLDHEVHHDALTGLKNRHYAYQAFETLLKEKHLFYLVLMDIDRFKRINDTYGHVMGDSDIQAVSTTILAHLPKDAFACRWGGEEFLVVFHTSLAPEVEAYQKNLQAAMTSLVLPHQLSPFIPASLWAMRSMTILKPSTQP